LGARTSLTLAARARVRAVKRLLRGERAHPARQNPVSRLWHQQITIHDRGDARYELGEAERPVALQVASVAKRTTQRAEENKNLLRVPAGGLGELTEGDVVVEGCGHDREALERPFFGRVDDVFFVVGADVDALLHQN
jgi:hypothetical protein